MNSQGSPCGSIVSRQLRVASDPWEADPLIWDHQLGEPGQFILIFRITIHTWEWKSAPIDCMSKYSLDHFLMQNHYNNGINFKDQMCQIFTYFVEKGMVALEDDEAVCIPEKIRLSMLNLTMSSSDPAFNSWRIHSVCLQKYNVSVIFQDDFGVFWKNSHRHTNRRAN